MCVYLAVALLSLLSASSSFIITFFFLLFYALPSFFFFVVVVVFPSLNMPLFFFLAASSACTLVFIKQRTHRHSKVPSLFLKSSTWRKKNAREKVNRLEKSNAVGTFFLLFFFFSPVCP